MNSYNKAHAFRTEQKYRYPCAEQRLCVGILTQALYDLLGSRFASMEDTVSAFQWFMNNEVYEGSFYWICDALNFEAKTVRKKIMNSTKDELKWLISNIKYQRRR